LLINNTLEELIDKLQLKSGDNASRISNISGSYDVVKLKDELVESLYDEAVSPKLIT